MIPEQRNILKWVNKRKYNHDVILWIKKIISIRLKKYNGILWVENQEINQVLKYIKKNNIRLNSGVVSEGDDQIDRLIILSIYNQIKTQNEIKLMWNSGITDEELDNAFVQLANIIKSISDPAKNLKLNIDTQAEETIEFIRTRMKHKENLSEMDLPIVIYLEKWIRQINLPIQYLLLYVKKYFYKFRDLTKYFAYMKYLVIEKEKELRKTAMNFELNVENMLENTIGDKFITEDDIKYLKLFNITPDILLLDPIIIELEGIQYDIHWIDAKNFFHAGIPFMTEKLKTQAAKYNKEFGMGAFIFSFGFDELEKIPGVLMLSF
jgi:hypothetical protein